MLHWKTMLLPAVPACFPNKHFPGFMSLASVLPYLGSDLQITEFHYQLSLVAAKDTQHSLAIVHFIRRLNLLIMQTLAPLLNFMCKADGSKSGILL